MGRRTALRRDHDPRPRTIVGGASTTAKSTPTAEATLQRLGNRTVTAVLQNGGPSALSLQRSDAPSNSSAHDLLALQSLAENRAVNSLLTPQPSSGATASFSVQRKGSAQPIGGGPSKFEEFDESVSTSGRVTGSIDNLNQIGASTVMAGYQARKFFSKRWAQAEFDKEGKQRTMGARLGATLAFWRKVGPSKREQYENVLHRMASDSNKDKTQMDEARKPIEALGLDWTTLEMGKDEQSSVDLIAAQTRLVTRTRPPALR